MQNIVLSGLHAIAFLVSPRVKLLDADFEAIQHTTSSESNFMAYLPGVINFESRLCTVDQRPRITKKESLWLAEALNAQTPLEVMVDNANDRRHSGRLKSVLRPDGVLGDLCFEVDEGLYCVLPELALVQAARTCTDTELVVLMSLLFGVFAKDAGANGLVPRRSVSSPAQVQRFVQRCRESCTKEPIGLSRVEGLLSCAVVKAASPKEIECALRLGYPVNLGGCGLGLPEMNYELAIPRTNRSRYCDLYWPEQNVAVEYQGAKEHASVDALESDALHNNDLVSIGVPVFNITAGQLRDLTVFNRVARQVENQFTAHGKLRARKVAGLGFPATAVFHDAQRALKSEIDEAFTRFGF